VVRVCVLGSINTDLTFRVNVLPHPGETVLASRLAFSPGGKGANQAVAAARAGAQVQFVGAVGSDSAADALVAHLRANNIGTDGLVRVPGPSGSAAIMVDAHAQSMIAVAPGANAHLTLDSVVAGEFVEDCDVLLMQLEIPVPTAIVAARTAYEAGATVMLNASPASEGLDELAALSDIVVVNEAEAAEWHWPARHLVVTRGAKGATCRTADNEIDVPAPRVEAVDSTGAGDVFAGVLAAGWTIDPHRALRRACVAGALATLVPGAGDCAPLDGEIEEALRERTRGAKQAEENR
jgi:ribokinase